MATAVHTTNFACSPGLSSPLCTPQYDADNLLTRGQTIPALKGVGASDPRVLEGALGAGEYSLHHLCTAHGGGCNKASTRRIGFNATFCASHVSSVRPGGAFGMQIRGPLPSSMAPDPSPVSGLSVKELHAARDRKQAGLAASIMDGADLEKFAAVSNARVGRNHPAHLPPPAAGSAVATSLASVLLKDRP